MGLSCKVYDYVEILRLEEGIHRLPVGYVRLHELKARVIEQGFECDEIARV